jgi:pilus assembly protein FimV
MGSNDPADREDIALSTSELDDVLSSAEIRSESGNDEESGLEKYGIWIKIEPETLESGSILETGPAAGSRLTAEEEQLLGELEADAEEPTLAAQADIHAGLRSAGETADFEGLEKDLQELDASGGEGLDEEVADLDLDLEGMPAEQGKEIEIEVPLSDNIPELDSLEEAAEQELRGAGPASSDAILKKIEQDLKQIKREIQNLKKELAGRGAEAGAHGGAAPGFFSEEEDDSIALTGDELDNILNTAEITEEQAGAGSLEDLQAGSLPEAVEELSEVEDLQEPGLPEAVEELAEPALDAAEDLELLEPGSLSAEPEEVQIELEEKPAAVDLDLGGLADELPEAGELELEELEENGASELVLEEPAGAPLPNAEELGLEEASPEDVLGMEELAVEPAAEPLELEGVGEEGPAAAESLELVEELPDLSLADEQGAPATEASTEPIELELMEDGAAEPLADLPGPSPAARPAAAGAPEEMPEDLREDVKSVLSYLDQLLEALPEDKIKQFAQSEYFGVYKRLFEELGLGA